MIFFRASSGNLPSFAASVVKEMKRLDDVKPGTLSRLLLPLLQSHLFIAPFCLPSKVTLTLLLTV